MSRVKRPGDSNFCCEPMQILNLGAHDRRTEPEFFCDEGG